MAEAFGRTTVKIDDIVTSDDLRLLADIGFMASSRGRGEQADTIFAAIRALRPEEEAGFVGGAIVGILAGDPDAAIRALKDAPTTVATQTFRGIALVLSGRTSEGRETLKGVVQAAPDTSFARLAQNAMS